MKFAIKCVLGGISAAGIGIWWIVDGVIDGPVNQFLGGLTWKGPLLLLAGAALGVFGFRMLRDIFSPVVGSTAKTDAGKEQAEPNSAVDGGRNPGS